MGAQVNWNCRRALAAIFAVMSLAACEPTLKSQLPTGTAAYTAINATAEPRPTAGSYLLRPGDHVGMTVYQETDLTVLDEPIDEAGMLSLPLVGEVHAAGLSAAALSANVQRAYGARFLRDPQVTIRLVKAGVRTISVEGQVMKAGQFEIDPGSNNTLLGAIAMAGSPNETAKLDEVLVFRTINGQRAGARFDLTAIRAGRAADPQILPGDVVVVGFSSLRGAYKDVQQIGSTLLYGIFQFF